ncbi:DUF1266 domain-containing protein [Sphingobacterium sp. HMA12]|uniref:DUF1266 domain-containing protein n=1 Tax=Sphingobacterium sp. HMA12 TaxID=2050894 RepID=UPI000CE9D155|nr:DUF1266 domain-containing protein [Sphingobacterium sp. HMA12]
MFKFFKELLSAVKEGVRDAQEELAQEAEMDKTSKEQVNGKEMLKGISYEEQFGTALGAAFRVIVFGDWFTVFGSADDDGTYPIHLYQFGNYPKQAEYSNEFSKLLKRDFAIEDTETCLHILAAYCNLLGVKTHDTVLKGREDQIDSGRWDIARPGVDALAVAVGSHIVAAATDVGYLPKSAALDILKNLSSYARLHFKDWHTFSEKFLEGEQHVGLNNKIGKSYLKRYIGYLREKIGSPWNNIDWNTQPPQDHVLSAIAWTFQAKSYRSSQEFEVDVAEYQRDILADRAQWDANEIVVDAAEIELCYMCWIKDMEDLNPNETLLDDEEEAFDEDNEDSGYYQVEICARLRASNEKNFTALDLLYQMEKQLIGKELGDHIFFEGLDRVKNHPGDTPLYYISFGS